MRQYIYRFLAKIRYKNLKFSEEIAMEAGKMKKTVNETLGKITDGVNIFVSSVFGKIPKTDTDEIARAAVVRRRVGAFVGFMFMSFLLSGASVFAESYPFALALLCAAGQTVALPVYIGSVLGSVILGKSVFLSVFIYTLAFLSRYVISKKVDNMAGEGVFGENLQVRSVLCAAMGFIVGMYGVFVHKFDVLSVINLAIMTLLTPILCVIFSMAMSKMINPTLREVALGGFLWVFVFCLKNQTLLGFSMAGMLSFLAVLYVSYAGGMFRGAVTGILCALAFDPACAIALATSGLLAGALWQVGAGVAVSAAVAAAVGWSLYTRGFTSIFGFASDAMFAGIVFLPLVKTGLIPKDTLIFKKQSAGVVYDDEKIKLNENARLEAMSDAFDELSELFMKLAEKQRIPGSYELYGVCDSVFSANCRKCAMSGICWKKDYATTADLTAKMVTRLRNGGALSAQDIPDFFRMRCRSIDKIVAEINLGAANLLEDTVKRDKTELFALDYQAISRLLRQTAEGKERENTADPELSKKFAKVLSDLEVSCMGVYAYGTRKKTLVAGGINAGSIEYSTSELKNAVSKALEMKIGDPKFEFSGKLTTLSFESLPTMGARSNIRSKKKEGESICGDVCSVFSGRDGRYYALICDGMGSGRQAAMAAKISAVFLEKMLSAGNSKDVTLRLLSNFIRARGDECHSTVDLFEADLYTGSAEFVKSGAAPSYLIRDGAVYKMDARTLPLGITKEIDTKALVISLKPKDMIVMVSDGVDSGVCENMIEEMAEKSPSQIADALYESSKDVDDVSIIVLEIVNFVDIL